MFVEVGQIVKTAVIADCRYIIRSFGQCRAGGFDAQMGQKFNCTASDCLFENVHEVTGTDRTFCGKLFNCNGIHIAKSHMLQCRADQSGVTDITFWNGREVIIFFKIPVQLQQKAF